MPMLSNASFICLEIIAAAKNEKNQTNIIRVNSNKIRAKACLTIFNSAIFFNKLNLVTRKVARIIIKLQIGNINIFLQIPLYAKNQYRIMQKIEKLKIFLNNSNLQEDGSGGNFVHNSNQIIIVIARKTNDKIYPIDLIVKLEVKTVRAVKTPRTEMSLLFFSI